MPFYERIKKEKKSLMKRFLLYAIIGSRLILFSNQLNAQRSTHVDKKTMELIMEVPNADAAKSFKVLKKKLSSIPQVSVEGFCDTKKLLMLKINPEEYFNVLVAVDEAGFRYYIKKELHIAEVIGGCEAGELYTKESTSLE